LLADVTPLRRSPEFRRLWWGLGLANIGTALTATAVGLEVYDLTGSTFAVGLLGAAGLVPVIVLGLYGGALADIFDRRKLALIASVVMWLATLGIVTQAWLDLRRVWLLYALVAVQAGASSVNGPARSAIIPRLVSMELLPAANALNMVTTTLAALTGPMVGAALVAAVGYAHTYLIDAVTFTFALYAILRLPPMLPQRGEQTPTTATTGWRLVVQGLQFLRGRRNLLMTFLLDMSAMVLAQPRSAFPAAAAVILGGGKTTAGLLSSAVAVGSLLAAVFSGPLGRVRRQGRSVVLAVSGWGLGVAACGVAWVGAGRTSPHHLLVAWLVASVVALALAGACDAVSATFRGTILQSATPDDMRGRVQGVFFVVVTGGPRLGDLVVGGLSSRLGEGWATVVGGLACVACVFLLTRWHRPFLAYDAHHPVA
jgi:MFS family permease